MESCIEIGDQPSGPGDDRVTAEQIVKMEGLGGNLRGKTILITGGTAGLVTDSLEFYI